MISEFVRQSESKLTDIYNFQYVTPMIASAGQPDECHLSSIAAAGFGLVINLGIENSAYGIPQEQDVVNRLHMRYESIPVEWERPRMSDFDYFCMVMLQNRRQRVFIHCAANKRASVFIALYRFLVLGMDKEHAFRPLFDIWTPNPTWAKFIDDAVLSHFTIYTNGA